MESHILPNPAGKLNFDLRPTLVDRVVGYFSPAKGLERTISKARQQYVTHALGGSYTGARKDRRQTENWETSKGDADEDIRWDLETARERSRDLNRNNALAHGALNNIMVHVVGSGLSPRPEIDFEFLGMTEDAARQWEDSAERLFALWANSPDCDLTRDQNFYGLQALALGTTMESGDTFVLLPFRERPTNIFGLKVQIVEGDRVCNKDFLPDTKNLRSGVVIDDDGAPKAYQFLKTHPGAFNRDLSAYEWMEVPAFGGKTGRRMVHHLFSRLRPGQNRGMPELTPVMELVKQMGTYTDSEAQRAVISSFFTVFVKSLSGEGLAPGLPTDAPGSTSGTDKPGEYKLAPGAILDLAPGEEVQFADPKSPNSAFDPFVQAIFRQIGIGLGIPYEVLTMHYTASYSAARAAILHAWKFFNSRRDWLAAKFCQPIYEAWLEEAIARGYLAAPGFFKDPAIRAAYCNCQWIGDQMGQLNPKDEVDAAAARVEMGISDINAEAVGYSGRSFRKIHKNRVNEHKLRASGGLEPEIIGVYGRASYPPGGGGPDAGAQPGAKPAPQDNQKGQQK